GGWAAELLVRAGIGSLTLADCDVVGETNINRQLPALHSTVGQSKCAVLRNRLLDINPELKLDVLETWLDEDNLPALLDGRRFDWAVDAIDTLSPKIALIRYLLGRGVPLVSSMGSGAKVDATQVRLDDISRTRECPLAQQLRKRLHRLGIYEGFQAVYSLEPPRRESVVAEHSRCKRSQVGTVSYLPAVFGCVCAQAVVRGISGR
ncbi:MAG: tRNA threonylcarbamoyladenosine dehydratase, partial [Bacteroidales bacterium]|nr:tRNA threonylcarbamoyladenosine dehydratase [Bacteroidales bacterium]